MNENENQEVIKNFEGSYVTGIIGAVIGGLIASIPWILAYSYANMIVAVLATLIAGGAFLGYKILKGKIGKGLPVIITTVSLIVVIFVTLVICPMVLLKKEGLNATWNNLERLYAIEDVKSAIMQDLLVSVAFTVLGIAAVVRSVSIQIKNGTAGENLKFNTQAAIEEDRKRIQEQSEVVKKVCVSLNCMQKENAVTKQEIANELEMTYNIQRNKINEYFSSAQSVKLLKKYKGKYYYDDIDEQSKLLNAGNINHNNKSSKTLAIIVVIIIVIGIIIAILGSIGEEYKVPNTDITLTTLSEQAIYTTKEELSEIFGEDYAEYYDFAILDEVNNKYEIYGTIMDKSNIDEDYDANTLIQADREYIVQNWGEENVSKLSDKEMGGKVFKSYDYKYKTQNTDENGEIIENEYIAVIYLCETNGKFVWIDCYTDLDFEVSKMDEVINKIIK